MNAGKEFVRLMQDSQKKGTSALDTTAEVVRTEGNTAWVHFPGGVEETPVKMTVNAEPGDIVQVRVSRGRAWLTGNASSPPTDNKEAYKARDTADDAKKIALESEKDAKRAQDAADSAEKAAEKAWNKAEEAETAANEAKDSAKTANYAAKGALTQLSVVEDVVGTLNWITEHGTYEISQDAEPVPGKHYFTRRGDTYSIVMSPSGNPAELGYYELTSVDEAISNYVASHLALTNAGLWVTNDDDSYKVLLASDGMKVYDDLGHLVATFGENISFSSNKAQYIGGENAYIIFDPDNQQITVGGNTTFGNKSLSEMLEAINGAKNAADSVAEMQRRMDSGEFKGEDATVLRIDSSRGTVFKNNTVSTVMTVTVFHGSHRINDLAHLRQVFGSSACLQWYWQRIDDDDYGLIVASDHKLSNDGFSLTLTPDEVDTKVTFRCELIAD